jgi:hypothetical protein
MQDNQEYYREFFPTSTPVDVSASITQLEFLVGYYEARSNTLAGSSLEQIVRRDYEQAVASALAVLRRGTTNDLGSDPHAWIQRYGR